MSEEQTLRKTRWEGGRGGGLWPKPVRDDEERCHVRTCGGRECATPNPVLHSSSIRLVRRLDETCLVWGEPLKGCRGLMPGNEALEIPFFGSAGSSLGPGHAGEQLRPVAAVSARCRRRKAAVGMVLSLDRLRELRSECLAEDLPSTLDMCDWTEAEAMAFYESGGVERPGERRYPRVYVTSDVHTDRENNMQWCRDLPKHPHGDVLIVAGDCSHRLEVMETTLKIFVERFTRGAPSGLTHARACPLHPSPLLTLTRPRPPPCQSSSSLATTTCG